MKKFLHVGCGNQNKKSTTREFRRGSWEETRLDIDPAVNPDIVATITDMAGVEDSRYSALFTSHTVEHLYPHEVSTALSEFYRVLGDDGFAVITCPDLKAVAKYVAADKLTDILYHSPAGPISPIDILFGHRASVAKGNVYMSHKGGFTAKTLKQELLKVGFTKVVSMSRAAHFDIWILAVKKRLTDNDIRTLALQHFPK